MALKAFIQFEILFAPEEFEIGERTYKPEQFNLLHGMEFPIHSGFDPFSFIVSIGRFYWDENKQSLFLRMWLTTEEINYFEKEIFTGQMIPVNIRICPSTVSDQSMKNYYDEFIENYKY